MQRAIGCHGWDTAWTAAVMPTGRRPPQPTEQRPATAATARGTYDDKREQLGTVQQAVEACTVVACAREPYLRLPSRVAECAC